MSRDTDYDLVDLSLSDDVIEKFNAFGKGELKKVDDLGDALMKDAPVDNPTKISAVH